MACCDACHHFHQYAGTTGGRCAYHHEDTLTYCHQCEAFARRAGPEVVIA
jgi:hypothetical protein